MNHIDKDVDNYISKFLMNPEKVWQPTDFLPDSHADDFYEQITELRELSKELPYDFWITLIGDTITEEALPSYEAWVMEIEGVDSEENNGWAKWFRWWSAEENRHGDVLNKFLYLSGRVNMREVEISTHYLIADGFDIGTSHDPYKNFIYTSFQEMATFISHDRVSRLAKKYGSKGLARMCKIIAGDEMRHHLAYSEFVRRIFELDPNEMMMAFYDMLKLKIVMPAHFVRESGEPKGRAFEIFSESAQRLGVYTGDDYVEIIRDLIKKWEIDQITELNDTAERARDYIMALPDRLDRITKRIIIPEHSPKLKWVY